MMIESDATMNDKMNGAIKRAEAYSPYLRLLMARYPEVLSNPKAPLFTIESDMPIHTALRRAKAQLALRVALGDLAGILSLDDVVTALSDFADTALDQAVVAAITAHVPGAEPTGFAVISLGKHGGRELNYSSDIDPIFLFDPATLPHRPREEPAEAAVRIGRRVMETMQTRDGDGYVFRMDLRLRPSPEVTPIVLPVNAAISYYESSALAWERAAFIRARASAGDIALGEGFLEAIRPFVWRRGLDFGASQEMRAMTHKIRDHYVRGQAFGPGFDLKRGRGGIREVEFFTQIHQLIHGGRMGGRNIALRSGNTVEALTALVEAGLVDRTEGDTLTHAYRLYRTIEHRLQMVDDQQTHSLPKDMDALDNVARLHGLDAGAGLLALLQGPIEAVGRLYDSLEGEQTSDLPQETARLSTHLSDQGVGEANFLAERIAEWRSGRLRALRTPAAQSAFEAVLPALVTGFSQAPDPRTAIMRLDNVIERLPSAINLFRLLEARPPLLTMVINILCVAPTLANDLAHRAALLDGLIDATALDPVGSVDALAQRFVHDDPTADLEQRLDRVRQEVGEIRFAQGVQIIEGISDPLDVAKAYAHIAEAAVRVVADAVRAEFERQHGRVPGSDLIILALGRMGGAELTHASDLDLIYLFDGDFAAESDGVRPLGAVHYYNRLAQRVTAGLSVATAAGPLYEVDTRLRPSGADGPLAVSLDGFARYQIEDAWTWEHMALTRARVIYGPADRAEAIIVDVLNRDRDTAQLLADAAKMRSDMAAHKSPKGPLDVKLAPGGLVDLEFILHVTQLTRRAGFVPDLGRAIAALSPWPVDLAAAHRLMTRLLVTLRLVAPDLDTPPVVTQDRIARACGTKDWDDLMTQLAHTQANVSTLWKQMTGE
jgi:[glutamine synthetase] adenylyltransferase / [glutamine synthetase]-adenylyl-L-tyrosine phosphorylase